jgi:hypothetical protein
MKYAANANWLIEFVEYGPNSGGRHRVNSFP